MAAFQAYHEGSWQPIKVLKVCNGQKSLQFEHHACLLKDHEVIQSLRLGPRKAMPSDCESFLKPGVDICLLSDCQDMEHSIQRELKPVWHDARIISIVRRPHKSMCKCHFWVICYKDYDLRRKRMQTLDIEVIKVPLHRIFILQRLNKRISLENCIGSNCIEDCPTLKKSRLFNGTFSSEVAYLVVLSGSDKLDIEVRVVQQKLAYIILNTCPNNMTITFEKCNGVIRRKTEVYVPLISDLVIFDNNISESGNDYHILENESSDGSTEFIGLRRSKRRRVHADSNLDSGGNMLNYQRKEIKYQSQTKENSCIIASTTMSKLVPSQPHKSSDLKLLKLNVSDELLLNDSNESIKEKCKVYKQVKRPEMSKNNHVLSHNAIKEIPVKCQKKNMSNQDDSFVVTKSSLQNPKSSIKASLKKRKLSKHFNTGFHSMKHDSCASRLRSMLDSQIRNIRDQMRNEEEPQFSGQHEANHSEDEQRLPWKFIPSTEPVEENLEHADLWKAMDNALLVHNPYKLSQDGENTVASKRSNETKGQTCSHEYELHEEHGLLCKLCYFVAVERRYVMPTFFEKPCTRTREKCDQDLNILVDKYNLKLAQSCNVNSSAMDICNNALSLIPEMAKKLHEHQIKAFHFLWRHIVGSVDPQQLGKQSNNLGGCVISHSPGSGKTFLMIAFILSYLNLFPKRKPLIVVPKIVLCVWIKEFKKWGLPYPVYQIGAQRTNMNIKHVISCLEILHKWHQNTSVLLMSYSSFFSLTKMNLKSSNAKSVAEFLKRSPGILILDEGHNPRSTKSKLRKALMEVNTNLRILLSGTLYQNNFIEYFNTLYLARPSFVFEVVNALKPGVARRWKRKGDDYRNVSQARRFFKEEIANRVNSSKEEERKHGLNLLCQITNHFIDVYTSGATDQLPGLESYTILIKSTDMQQIFLSKLQNLNKHKSCPFELQHVTTIGSMHSWLFTTFNAIGRYLNAEELRELENHKFDLEVGSKVKFVINLVQHCVLKGEKVLIFCHYLQPIHFLVEFFEYKFKWQRGVHVLVLYGDQDVDERGKLIEQFNGESAAQVLIASTTACAEGISLTAASRVVLLDFEWNPSKNKQAIARVFRPGQEKVVYAYRLLACGTFEEDKYGKTVLKERQSQMIFRGCEVEDASDRQTQNIDDDVLRQLVEKDMSELFQIILKHESGSEEML